MFDVNSRYYNLNNKFITLSNNQVVTFKERRILPKLIDPAQLMQITYVAGDRLDLMAHRILGDPLNFWQIADVNTAMQPMTLTAKVGNTINIPINPIQS